MASKNALVSETVFVAKKLSRTALGFILLVIVDLIWVGSGAAIQMIYRDLDYDKPVFVTLYSIASSVCLFATPTACRLLRSGALSSSSLWESRVSFPCWAQVIVLTILWILLDLTYNVSLKFTAVSLNTCLSSTSSVFTFIFSLLLLNKQFRIWSALGVIFGVAGVIVTIAVPPSRTDENAMHNTPAGYTLALLAACFYGIFTSLVKRWVKDETHMVLIFSLFGVAAIVVGIPALVICHFAGWEEFVMPTWPQFGAISANAFIGTVISDLILSFVVILLNPLVACIGLTCTIPISCIIDACVFKFYDFSLWFLVGALLVFVAVLTVSLDQQQANEAEKSERDAISAGDEFSPPMGGEEEKPDVGMRSNTATSYS